MDAALQKPEPGPLEPHHRRGTNQTGMRDYNERLVLSLVRQHGALAKTDIARMTGLSAQTVSVIMRELEAERLLVRGAPVIKTGFGTTGPGPEAVELDPAILFVPLSAFDAAGHRIGYGAGHYDRAIDRLRAKGLSPKLIGIAFDCQEVASVPAEPHDVALDAMLTESGLRFFIGTNWQG